MTFNEAFFLPFWERHYSFQAGPENCFVLDHGSDDGSTASLSVNVVNYPRSFFDENARGLSCSDFCSSLLFSYERVIFTDIDELIVCDPTMGGTLYEYMKRPDLPNVIRSIGMDVLHDERVDGPLDPSRPILSQRSVFRPYSALCKPTVISERVEFGIGMHSCNKSSRFDNLFLLHLAYADFGQIAKRQRKRNAIARIGGGGHHDIAPDVMVDHIRNDYIINKPRVPVTLSRGDENVSRFVRETVDEFGAIRDHHPETLWVLSDEGRAAFGV